MEDPPISSTPKKSKVDLSSSLDLEFNFWDFPNRDLFFSLSDKPITHGRVVDLDDIEARNCKVKDLFVYQGWSKFFSVPHPKVYEPLVRMFYANLHSSRSDKLETLVLGKFIVLDSSLFDSIFQCKCSGFPMLFKIAGPIILKFLLIKPKDVLLSVHLNPFQTNLVLVMFETRIIAHIVGTTLLPRTDSFLTFSLRDTFPVYYLVTKLKIKLSSWVINFMIESAEDPTSLPYGMAITHILEAHISLSAYFFTIVSKSYNSRAFASMRYVCVKGSWVKKHESDVKTAHPNSKPKPSCDDPVGRLKN